MSDNLDLIETNELSKNAQGGSELMLKRIYNGSIDRGLLEKFQIIPSRVRELKEDKYRVFLANDLPNDPESNFLQDDGWKQFHKLVFVSHWQRDAYVNQYHIPYSKTAVLPNAIMFGEKSLTTKFDDPTDGKIKLIYHTTPHRGLKILVPVFLKLLESKPNIHLDVYSSFKIYGWESRDQEYQALFDQIKNHPNMTYHGFQPNEVVRDALQQADIFAYPSIWPETFCLSLAEAMAHGCICVHPNFAALPEVAANWTWMYNMHEDIQQHAEIFYHVLGSAIDAVQDMRQNARSPLKTRLQGQMSYAALFYNWDYRKHHWTQMLQSITAEPLVLPKEEENVYVYRA